MEDKHVSRRDFLKIAGVAGATIGLRRGPGRARSRLRRHRGDLDDAPPRRPLPRPRAGRVDHQQRGRRPPRSAPAPKPAATSFSASCRRSTGPLALFAKADDWWVDYAMKAAARRDRRRRRQEAHDPDQAGRQPVRHQPGLPGGRRPHQQRQGRPHDGVRLPGHRQPGGRPVRSLRLPVDRQLRPLAAVLSSAAAPPPTSRSSGPTPTRWAWNRSWRTSSPCGTRCPPTRRSASSSPTTPTARPGPT